MEPVLRAMGNHGIVIRNEQIKQIQVQIQLRFHIILLALKWTKRKKEIVTNSLDYDKNEVNVSNLIWYLTPYRHTRTSTYSNQHLFVHAMCKSACYV